MQSLLKIQTDIVWHAKCGSICTMWLIQRLVKLDELSIIDISGGYGADTQRPRESSIRIS